MTTVYVVVSDTIAYEQNYHGIHGVYKSIESAHVAAMSTITSIAKNHGHNVTKDDVFIEYEDFMYENSKIDIVVSYIEQRLS